MKTPERLEQHRLRATAHGLQRDDIRDRDNGSLLHKCLEGDGSAWNTIVDRYQRLVYAIPLREGLTVDEAADVTQETFAALMGNLDRIERPDRLASWLMTVARRLAWRERHRAGRREVDLASVDIESGVDVSDESATVAWVYDAIQELGEPCRTLVASLFFDPNEPSYAEIAIRLGRPLGSVGPLRARCLDRLRHLLEGSQ